MSFNGTDIVCDIPKSSVTKLIGELNSHGEYISLSELAKKLEMTARSLKHYIKISVCIGKIDKILKKDALQLEKDIENEKKNYYTVKEASKFLKLDARKILYYKSVNYFKDCRRSYFRKDSLLISKSDISSLNIELSFLKNSYTCEEIAIKLSQTSSNVKQLIKNKAFQDYKLFDKKYHVSKNEVDLYCKQIYAIKENFYSIPKTASLLNITCISIHRELARKNSIAVYCKLNKQKYLLKSQIDNFLEVIKDSVSILEAQKCYGIPSYNIYAKQTSQSIAPVLEIFGLKYFSKTLS